MSFCIMISQHIVCDHYIWFGTEMKSDLNELCYIKNKLCSEPLTKAADHVHLYPIYQNKTHYIFIFKRKVSFLVLRIKRDCFSI